MNLNSDMLIKLGACLTICILPICYAVASDPYDVFYKLLRDEDYTKADEMLEALDESKDSFRYASASINLLIKTGKRQLALKEINRLMIEYSDDDRLAENVFSYGIMLGIEDRHYYSRMLKLKGALEKISREPLLVGFMAFLYPIVYDSENSDLIAFYERDNFIGLLQPNEDDELSSSLPVDLSAFRVGRGDVVIEAVSSGEGDLIADSNHVKIHFSASEKKAVACLKIDQKFSQIALSNLLEIEIGGEKLSVRINEKAFVIIPQINEVYSLHIPGVVISLGRVEGISDGITFRVRVEWFDDGYKTTSFIVYE